MARCAERPPARGRPEKKTRNWWQKPLTRAARCGIVLGVVSQGRGQRARGLARNRKTAGTPADGRSPERTQSWSEATGQEDEGRTQKAMRNRLLKWPEGLDKREGMWYDNIPLETGISRDLNN
jgi:hypothetical protein